MKSNQDASKKKQHIIEVENSFILLADVNPLFWAGMKKILDQLEQEKDSWFESTTLPPHLTVAMSDPDKAEQQPVEKKEIEAIRQQSTSAISELLNKQLKQPLFLSPVDILIAPNGWVLLQLNEVLLDKTCLPLKVLHTEMVKILKQEQYKQKFKYPEFILEGYKPHISLGKVRTVNENNKPNQDELEKVRKILNENNGKRKRLLLNEISKVPILSLSHFQCIHHLNLEEPLIDKIVPKLQFNVLSVSKNNDDKQDRSISLEFDKCEKAKTCSEFSYTLGGICSRSEEGEAIPLAPIVRGESKFTLDVTKDQYRFFPEVVENCPADVSSLPVYKR